jgi:phosphorylcholine metabolism protein LicD
VDLAMPREDYERLANIYEGSLSLHTYQNDREHMFPYTKLFSKETPIVTVKDEEYHIDGQCFAQIDLYPIDGLGTDKGKALRHLAAVSKKKKLLFLNLTKSKSKNPITRFLLFFIRKLSPRRIIRSIDKAMQKHTVNESSFLTRWREGGVSPNAVPRDVFGTPVLTPFEGKSFYAPHDAHAYLTLVYGDYTVDKRCDTGLRHATTRNEIAEKMAKDLTE